jgi:hypothetical protein
MKTVYETAHKNILDNESRFKLRGKRYDFNNVEDICKAALNGKLSKEKPTSGPFTDEDTTMPRVEEFKKVNLNFLQISICYGTSYKTCMCVFDRLIGTISCTCLRSPLLVIFRFVDYAWNLVLTSPALK